MSQEGSTSDNNRRPQNAHKQPSTIPALAERKLAILDKAIAANPACLRLALERIAIGQELWEPDQVEAEMNRLEAGPHGDRLQLWSARLDGRRQALVPDANFGGAGTGFANYDFERHWRSFDRCFARLCSVLARMNTENEEAIARNRMEQFLVRAFAAQAAIFRQAGYAERAIGRWQAIVEFNLFAPDSVTELDSVATRRQAFEAYWGRDVARIGQVGAVHWNSIESGSRRNERSIER